MLLYTTWLLQLHMHAKLLCKVLIFLLTCLLIGQLPYVCTYSTLYPSYSDILSIRDVKWLAGVEKSFLQKEHAPSTNVKGSKTWCLYSCARSYSVKLITRGPWIEVGVIEVSWLAIGNVHTCKNIKTQPAWLLLATTSRIR